MVGGMTNWFNANLADFTYIFATVNVGAQLSSSGFQWLAPTYTGYAYVDGADTLSSYLAVLCATQNHPPGNLVGQVSQMAVPVGARAGLLSGLVRI